MVPARGIGAPLGTCSSFICQLKRIQEVFEICKTEKRQNLSMKCDGFNSREPSSLVLNSVVEFSFSRSDFSKCRLLAYLSPRLIGELII